ncbi:hypothetical protein MJO28_016049 [Puccinia striiformis f. sp. tritici]|uniref:Uncharacterized protein n=3 Tax=Puccinia striiformis TaxID=27350 RepID=A0A2S4UDZ0_9BASI|nr:hypothetical protein Pst134EA_028927 [Puccinia striiformis f. sp. tritici]KAI9623377.1 hypothetical protein H4Q26_014544 [Puccinia striiformis f. sp. tritici PST-130]POV95497.1 hypothetical protein PSHT_15635 [Puccinia striiformis]KAH9446942.1 hypothetical protein Pst134EA_028927 [Puccinia striiformis f. sp. tritici]KAI7936056.1 hypothetical protein MJO29_015359 [Puccinia striiformis f. sp. tritici]KAI7937150.1 hypothetical protein MJO28_016049 [Puccinia striiformis f. sp. tritici]
MDLALLVLPFLVFEVIMGITIDPTFRKLNKFKSRSIHPNEALESNTGGGKAGYSPPPDKSAPQPRPCCG